MLKLVFYTKEDRLKVRPALDQDDFSSSKKWKNEIEFILSDQGEFMMLWTSLVPDLAPNEAHALVELVGARYSVSDEYLLLKNLCPELIFQNKTNEWVFYGGSFNPWHSGHQSCLNLLPEEKVCLILPDYNPQKEFIKTHPVTKILEISHKARFKKNQFLAPSLILKGRTNPTIEWIEKVKNLDPQKQISLLMGFDSFNHINTWLKAKELLSILDNIYVISRLESEDDRNKAMIKLTSPHAKVYFLGKHDFEDVSSTEIRNKK